MLKLIFFSLLKDSSKVALRQIMFGRVKYHGHTVNIYLNYCLLYEAFKCCDSEEV
jgi:hypothetical protein